MRYVFLLAFVLVSLVPQLGHAQYRGVITRPVEPFPRYSEEQRRLARSTRALYLAGMGVGVGSAGPFIGAVVQGADEGARDTTTLTLGMIGLAGWFIEPALMLVADQQINNALGNRRSVGNYFGWALYALTIALSGAGGILFAVEEDSDNTIGFTVAGGFVFLIMQVVTDVLGTTAAVIARRILRGEGIYGGLGRCHRCAGDATHYGRRSPRQRVQ